MTTHSSGACVIYVCKCDINFIEVLYIYLEELSEFILSL